jgi:hypothetical protein
VIEVHKSTLEQGGADLGSLSVNMAGIENESTKVIDKFKGDNFNLWKFKVEMVLESMDLKKIVEETEDPPSFDDDPKVIKDYN